MTTAEELPPVIRAIREVEPAAVTTAAPRPATYSMVITYGATHPDHLPADAAPDADTGGTVLTSFASPTPLHIPRAGDSIKVFGRRVSVLHVEVEYDDDGDGDVIHASVDVWPFTPGGHVAFAQAPTLPGRP